MPPFRIRCCTSCAHRPSRQVSNTSTRTVVPLRTPALSCSRLSRRSGRTTRPRRARPWEARARPCFGVILVSLALAAAVWAPSAARASSNVPGGPDISNLSAARSRANVPGDPGVAGAPDLPSVPAANPFEELGTASEIPGRAGSVPASQAAAAQARLWLPYKPLGYYLYMVDCCGPIANWPNVRLDPAGIPQVTYDQGATYEYYPITIALFGLQGYSWHLRFGQSGYLEDARRAADWLLENQDRGTGAWLARFSYRIPAAGLHLDSPWPSAMAQGLGMSLLTRMAAQTGDPRYLRAAISALGPLRTSVRNGGVVAKFFGHPFYEEHPTTPPMFTLNGFMYTLVGLHDLDIAAPRSDAGALYARGLATLIDALRYFDLSSTSSYALSHITNPPRGVYTIPSYHQIHVMLLRALDSISPDRTLRLTAERWAAYPPCAEVSWCAP